VKTTLVIPDPVMDRLRAEARRQRVTMSALVEVALRRLLDASPETPGRVPPLPRWDSGGHLVDVADRDALQQVLDGA